MVEILQLFGLVPLNLQRYVTELSFWARYGTCFVDLGKRFTMDWLTSTVQIPEGVKNINNTVLSIQLIAFDLVMKHIFSSLRPADLLQGKEMFQMSFKCYMFAMVLYVPAYVLMNLVNKHNFPFFFSKHLFCSFYIYLKLFLRKSDKIVVFSFELKRKELILCNW